MALNTITRAVLREDLPKVLQAFLDKIKLTFQTLNNLVKDWGDTPSDSKYPSEKLVKDSLDGKQDDLGISASGDAGKFLNEQGDWAAPAVVKSLQYWSGGSTSIKGVYIGTCKLKNGLYAWITGAMSATNYYNSDPNVINNKGLAIGGFYLWACRSGSSLTARCRFYSMNARTTNTDFFLVYKKDTSDSTTYKVDFYVAFGPKTEGGGTATQARPFGLGINYLENHNADIPDRLTGITDDIPYDDYHSVFKFPFLKQNLAGLGSNTKPVFVSSDGSFAACNEMLLKSGSNATSGCADALLSALPDSWTEIPTDTTKLIRRDTNGNASFGQVTFLTVWKYILSKFPSLGWTGSSAKTLSEDVYNYLIGASITFSVNVTSMRKSTPYRVYVNWHGNILTIKNTSGSPISMAVGTVGTVSVANNNTYALPDLAPTTWTFIYDGSTLYAVPSSSVKYSLTESSSILAARATGDGSGNTIRSTYAKKAVEGVSNGSYGANIGYIAPTALCVIGDSHTASSYSVEDIISKTLSASYRNNNGRVYVILNTKSTNVTLTGFVSGTWSLVAGRHTTVVRWNGAYYRQD